VATSLDVQSDEGMWNGSVLTASAFTTTAAQGSAQDNSSSTSNGCGAFLIVTSVSGTSPTGDVKIQHSADNVTYVDLITFTQATAATSEVKFVDSAPTINAIVGFGRNN
jgi:hypothetical protein